MAWLRPTNKRWRCPHCGVKLLEPWVIATHIRTCPEKPTEEAEG